MAQYIIGKNLGDSAARALVLEPTRVLVVSPLNADVLEVDTRQLKVLGFAFVNVAALKRAGWARIRSVRGTPLEFPRFVSESELGELTIVDPSGARRSAEPSECVGLGRGVILTVSQFEEYCRALLGRSLMPHWGRPFGL